jgi:acetoin utilization protein AcuB
VVKGGGRVTVKECMSRNPVTAEASMPVLQAIGLMKEKGIRRLPVMDKGKMVGIVAMSDLLKVSPSPATSLSIHEIHYLLGKMTLRDAMSRDVVSVREDSPIEEAAVLMKDKKIGGLPVLNASGDLVGIVTETDLFKVLVAMMGSK